MQLTHYLKHTIITSIKTQSWQHGAHTYSLYIFIKLEFGSDGTYTHFSYIQGYEVSVYIVIPLFVTSPHSGYDSETKSKKKEVKIPN